MSTYIHKRMDRENFSQVSTVGICMHKKSNSYIQTHTLILYYNIATCCRAYSVCRGTIVTQRRREEKNILH